MPRAYFDKLAQTTAAKHKAAAKGKHIKNPQVLRLKSGDNKAEANFGGVKRRMKRRNAFQNPKHAGAQFLASNWDLKHPGPEGLARAVQSWLAAHVDKVDPAVAWSAGVQTAKDAAEPLLSTPLRAQLLQQRLR